jgi:hypothetical protein
MDITDIKKTVFLLLPGFLNAPFIIFLIYIWQHRLNTLKFAMYGWLQKKTGTIRKSSARFY